MKYLDLKRYAPALIAGMLLVITGCTTVGPSPADRRSQTSTVTLPTHHLDPDLAAHQARAAKGDPEAQFTLGKMYETGLGAPQSYAEAAQWYRQAAEQGHAAAQFYLGAMYGSARGVARDYAAAVMWFRKSAEQGYRDAFYPMAYAHEHGIGVAKDDSQAIAWYLKSAEAGVWQAMDRLGTAYRNGELGLTPDAEKAKDWSTRTAATRGREQKFSMPVRPPQEAGARP